MTAKEKLLAAQAALEKRGAKDVKFFFSNLNEKPLSQVAEEVASALQAQLDGKVKALGPIGDRVTA
jgi:hypothetical protein